MKGGRFALRTVPLKLFLRFALVGVLNTGVDFALFAILLRSNFFTVVTANVVSYSLAILFSFTLNRSWTFSQREPSRSLHRQLGTFIAINVVSLLLSSLIVSVLSYRFHPLTAKFISLPATTVWNFCLTRYFVFPSAPLADRMGET